MALVKCPECGKLFSDLAEACPECAYPTGGVPKGKRKPKEEEQSIQLESKINAERQILYANLKKNPGTAAILSLIIPGAGSMYLLDNLMNPLASTAQLKLQP